MVISEFANEFLNKLVADEDKRYYTPDRKKMRWTVDKLWFDMILDGTKTIEGRLPKYGVAESEIGDMVLIKCKETGRYCNCVIRQKYWYPSCQEYLKYHMHAALPHVQDIELGITIYRKYISEKTEKELGIFAIEIKLT